MQVVGALLDADAPGEFINNLLLSVRSLLPMDKLVEVSQARWSPSVRWNHQGLPEGDLTGWHGSMAGLALFLSSLVIVKDEAGSARHLSSLVIVKDEAGSARHVTLLQREHNCKRTLVRQVI